MDTHRSILEEINEITVYLETDFPELYELLNEDPSTIPSGKNPTVDDEALKDYLESLKVILKNARLSVRD
ncbi:hypothetical protein QQ020_34340 [Fulvivirgaceae bacterium BMA12]|uniref:Uncharacterized protein n=1 Tax=Agaribacillus aureus TaxID=3051825 RepID=A0ABT8LLK7_9BACT|nr:hypothetical protein [Fulvivirgaceae bacterium BMA12]